MRASLRFLPLLSLLCACSFAAFAQSSLPPPPPGPGPMGPGEVPSVGALATVPNLSVQQQQQLRQLLIQRRDAHEALRQREWTEHDKIDTDSANRIRALLGEEEYVRYVKWSMGPGARGPGARGPGGRDGLPPPPRGGAKKAPPSQKAAKSSGH